MTPDTRPPEPAGWLRLLAGYWPMLLATVTFIIFLANASRDIRDLQVQAALTAARVQALTVRQDSLAQSSAVRDYMVCRVFELLLKQDKTGTALPQQCEAVFRAVGYR